MLFLHNKFLLYIFKCKWKAKPDEHGQKFLILFNTLARSTCCNVSLDIMITRQKYRMANVLNPRAFSSHIWQQQKAEAHRRIQGCCCNIQDGALCDIVNCWRPLTIITKRSILDVAAAALDPSLDAEAFGSRRLKLQSIDGLF